VQIDHTAGPQKGQQVRLAYDGEHRLLASERIQTGTDGQRHSVLTCYHYDPLSRRMGKQHLKRIPQGEGQKSEWRIQSSLWFGWDGDRMVTMQNERQASTTIYEPNSFVPMLRVDRQLQADDRRAKGETRTYHVHCNHLGTPEALIAQDSLELVWQIELDPWGQTQREYNPNNMLQPIRMQGQQLDAETGLFYNRYRYYDPAGGRYVTQDPIGLAGGTNKFIYPTNPVQMIDAFGLQPRPGNLSWGNWCGGGWSGGYETKIICRIPDHCIDSKRYPLFMAREVMRQLIDNLCVTTAVQPGALS
jgi:RHS repeat-associated protein